SLLFALFCASGLFSSAVAQTTNYSRRFGGSDGDFPTAITTDNFGTYITGYTYSTNFPGAPRRVGAGPNDADVFVTKLNDAGDIVWSVVIGGTGLDSPAAIAPDSVGNVYIAGRTTSTNFPTTSALQSSPSGNGDAFVFKLNLVGDVQYSTYLGGPGFDAATAIAVNTNTFEAIVVGTTAENLNGDVFITRLGPNGTNVTLSTFLRGSDYDSPSAVALDQFKDIYVAGSTRSLDFPATPGAYRTEMSFGNVGEAFVTKLNRNTGAIVYSTFLAMPTASPLALVVDSGEAAYIAGAEQFAVFGSPGAPTAPGAPRPPPSVAWNSNAAFLVRLAPSGSQLQYTRKYDTSGQ
ncbi:MAG: SBBP repeat-containing protein, partial [Gammaproteobacteria bacterium]